MWQHHYLVTELHRAAAAHLLIGAAQAELDALADWAALQPVRWVNEQPNGGWRYVPYHTTAGTSSTAIASSATWGEQMASAYADAPPSAAGSFMAGMDGAYNETYASFAVDSKAGALYPSILLGGAGGWCRAQDRGRRHGVGHGTHQGRRSLRVARRVCRRPALGLLAANGLNVRRASGLRACAHVGYYLRPDEVFGKDRGCRGLSKASRGTIQKLFSWTAINVRSSFLMAVATPSTSGRTFLIKNRALCTFPS